MNMKRICFFVLFLLSLTTGKSQAQVRTGDLLFVGIPADYTIFDDSMFGAIAASTGKADQLNYIHVAVLEVDENEHVWILDATLKHGVDRHPFDTFLVDFTLKDGSYPYMMVMRLKNKKYAKNAMDFVENAKKICGEGYDLYFMPDNGLHYCSELVYDAYVTREGKHLFHTAPMNFKSEDGTFPPYWVQLFQLIGRPIPQGEPGTNPNAMFKEKCLKKVGTIDVEER